MATQALKPCRVNICSDSDWWANAPSPRTAAQVATRHTSNAVGAAPRSCSRHAAHPTVDDAPEQASPELGPDVRAERTWTQWRVHKAIEQLPERQRGVIELLYWSDLSQSQVAALSGLPLGTVKTRTRGALLQLAKLLEGELD